MHLQKYWHGSVPPGCRSPDLLTYGLGLLLVLPWLNPFAGGPSTSVRPWLFSAVCVALISSVHGAAALNRAASAGLAGLSAYALVRSGWSPETLALVAACFLVFMAGAWRRRNRKGRSSRVLSRAPGCWPHWPAPPSPWSSISARPSRSPAGSVSSAVGEAYANLRQRNQFASLTVIGMASLFLLAPREMGRWPALAAMCWLAVGNAATTSRTGLLQMLVLGVLACAWPGPRRERALLWTAGLLAYVLAAIALPWLLEAALGQPGNRLWDRVAGVQACSSRRVLWWNVLELIAQKPWLGWGWGELDYAHFVDLYDGPRFCDILDNAHNLPLHLAVELGLPAALLAVRRPAVGRAARQALARDRSAPGRWHGPCWR